MSFWRRALSRNASGFVLALGGGGGRGLAHIGVLQALEEHKLRPSAIVGTSIGALFGAMYALSADSQLVRERVVGFLHSDAFTSLDIPRLEEANGDDETWLGRLTSAARQTILYARAASDISLANVEILSEIAETLCEGKSFADTKIPLYVTAVEFPGGECRLFSKGKLSTVLAASMAIPGVFDPVKIDNAEYLDGALASEIPSKEALAVSSSGEIVVAVNVGARPDPEERPTHLLGMMDWATSVKALYLRRYEKATADILIEPLHGYRQWHDFSNSNEEIQRGYDATMEVMPQILKALGR